MKKWLGFLLLLPALAYAEEFSFDVSSYEKKRYEWGGYLEGFTEYNQLASDTALYNLNFSGNDNPDAIKRFLATAELEGLYRFDSTSLNFKGHATFSDDYFGREYQTDIYELYYAANPSDQLNLEIGKRVIKWGKGYAWNPVGFIERAKDPNDPDLSREGFIIADADYIRSFAGQLKTLSIKSVILPVSDDINSDFSSESDINFAGKIYLLYRNTDIDFLFLSDGSRSGRLGLDFSRNITPNFELHGEIAYINQQTLFRISDLNQLESSEENIIQSLVGVRYLTETEITWVVEYYHNGAGQKQSQLSRFYTLASVDPADIPALFELANKARSAGYTAPNAGRDYLYLRASKRDSFNIVYLATALTSIININDQSFSLAPELVYTGFTNTESRLRMIWLYGDKNSEFGEKQNELKLEFRFRLFF